MLASRLLALLFCAALSSPALLTAGVCPESCNEYFYEYDWEPTCTSASIYDPCLEDLYCTRWNLQTGVWDFHVGDWQHGQARRIFLNDDFTLEGPSSATPLPITLRLHLGGEIQVCGSPHRGMNAHVTLRAGTAQQEWPFLHYDCTRLVIDQTLDLPFTKLPGQPFRVQIEAYASVFGAEVTFEGASEFILPAGYTIESCHGFQSIPIGVESATWTQVKRRFD